ncbi:YceI family protein [Patiriisocius sp. Uisw_017]|uniref:YceI family protein n=1 Tax=Patiriisocius sp. Uisw_017 TaxID=3230968 RepID=UPI0039EC90EC
MKNLTFKIVLIAIISMSMISCKNDKKEAAATDAKETAKASAIAERFVVDTAKSKVIWEGNKPLGSHKGTISIAQGEFMIENGTIKSGNFLIDMKSINVTDLEIGDGKEMLETHLMGTVAGKEGDFFNVNRHPTATFEITSVDEKDGKTMMSGNLKMLEKSNNITFPVTMKSNGSMMSVTSEEFEIDRTKWGINFGSKSIFDDLGDKFISDEMKITFAVNAKK